MMTKVLALVCSLFKDLDNESYPILIHSFRPFLKRLFKSAITQERSRHSSDTVPEFHAEVPQAPASEGLAQGTYGTAIAGFEPTIIRSKGFDPTNAPPCP